MITTTEAKRIQSKLSRNGVKMSLGEIKQHFEDKKISSPTDEDITTLIGLSNNALVATSGGDSGNHTITKAEASSMVMDTAEKLNVDLKLADVRAISTQLFETGVNFNDAVNEAKNIILAFIEYQTQTQITALNNLQNEVINAQNQATEKLNRMSSELNTKLLNDLTEVNNRQKQNNDDYLQQLKSHIEHLKGI